MEQAVTLETALGNTARLVAGISEEHWDAPTPCSQWKVRDLVNHTAGVMANFRNGARNQPIVGDADDFDLGVEARGFDDLVADNVAAWRERGELDSVVMLGDNEFPGAVAITINMLDAYVHGWDIAQATGQDAQLDPEICAALLGFSQQAIPPAPREDDRFHAVVPVPDHASTVDQLLGYLGRQP